MEELYNINLDTEDIKYLLDTNNSIFTLSQTEIKEKIDILKEYNVNDEIIKHTIITNAFYLTNDIYEVRGLLEVLVNFKININDILNINPFILNNTILDIKEYFKNFKNKGFNDEFIINKFIENPYIINEDI